MCKLLWEDDYMDSWNRECLASNWKDDIYFIIYNNGDSLKPFSLSVQRLVNERLQNNSYSTIAKMSTYKTLKNAQKRAQKIARDNMYFKWTDWRYE